MMNPQEFTVDDYITGEKFEDLCDIDMEKDPNWMQSIKDCPKDIITVFSQTHELVNRVPILAGIPGKKFIVVSQNSDGTFGEDPPARHFDYQWANVDNIIHWFAQNCEVKEPNVTPIPVAVENSYIFPPSVKQDVMHQLTAADIPKEEKTFLCFNIDTNKVDRTAAWRHCWNQPWSLCQKGFNNIGLVKAYMDQMARHWFIVSPDGNGIDCVRTWEALYMGAIPIVKRHVFTEYYAQFLPIAIVDSWDEVTPIWMRKTLAAMQSRSHNWNIIKMSYWRKRISDMVAGAEARKDPVAAALAPQPKKIESLPGWNWNQGDSTSVLVDKINEIIDHINGVA